MFRYFVRTLIPVLLLVCVGAVAFVFAQLPRLYAEAAKSEAIHRQKQTAEAFAERLAEEIAAAKHHRQVLLARSAELADQIAHLKNEQIHSETLALELRAVFLATSKAGDSQLNWREETYSLPQAERQIRTLLAQTKGFEIAAQNVANTKTQLDEKADELTVTIDVLKARLRTMAAVSDLYVSDTDNTSNTFVNASANRSPAHGEQQPRNAAEQPSPTWAEQSTSQPTNPVRTLSGIAADGLSAEVD